MTTFDSTAGNRAERRAAGRHRRRSAKSTAAVLTLATAAFSASVALSGQAMAAPIQGGVTGGGPQGGVTGDSQGGTSAQTPAPAPAPAPATTGPQPAENFWVAPPAEYNRGTRAYNPETGGGVSMTQYNSYSGGGNSGYSGYSDYSGGGNSGYSGNDYAVDPAPVVPAPVVVEGPTLPIEAPAEKMRFGRVIFDQPNWISDVDAEKTNRTTAVVEAMVTDYHRSTGMNAEEAEKIASAQVAGTAVGAGAGFVAGCNAVGIPTALGVSTVTGIVGANMGGMVPVPVVGQVTTGVAGTAIGAAAGYGVGCVLGGVPGAVAGGAAGYVTGTAYGAGEDATPIEAEVPNVEHEQIVEQVDATLTQWSQHPVGAAAVDAVKTFTTETAPALDEQARDFVAAQPGGEQVLEQVDATLETFFTDATPGLAANLISTAVGEGIAEFGSEPAPLADVAAPAPQLPTFDQVVSLVNGGGAW